MNSSMTNNLHRPFCLPNVRPHDGANIRDAEARQTHGNVAEVVPRRVHLAQALQKAHIVQARNTRALEQSYHALRASTRAMERRWDLYCTELEYGLDAPHWQDVLRHPCQMEEYQQRNVVEDMDEDGAEAAIGESHLRRTQASSPGRRETNILQERQAAWSLTPPYATAQGPQVPRQDVPVECHPLRQNPPAQNLATSYALAPGMHNARDAEQSAHERSVGLSEQDRQRCLSTQAASQQLAKSCVVAPKTPYTRHASLPRREQLAQLSELARQRHFSTQFEAQSTTTAKPSINIIPPTPPQTRKGLVGLQQQPRSTTVVESTQFRPQSPEMYFHSRQPQSVTLPGTIDSDFCKFPTVVKGRQEVPITHETISYQPGVEGHWVPRTEPTMRHAECSWRAKLQKKRKGEAAGRRRG
ncbi:MAG: hypothetical protein Q9177_003736 [Variospora cf. flavescens]